MTLKRIIVRVDAVIGEMFDEFDIAEIERM